MSRNIHAELPTTHPYSLFPHPARAPSMRQTTPLPPPPSGLKADAGERAAGYKYARGTAANSLPCHPLGGYRVGWLLGRSQGCPVPWGPGGSGASKRLLHFPPFSKGKSHCHFIFPGRLLICSEVGPSSSLGRNWELRMKGLESIHSMSRWSPGPLLLTLNTKVHSFTQHILTEGLLNARPCAQAYLHK